MSKAQEWLYDYKRDTSGLVDSFNANDMVLAFNAGREFGKREGMERAAEIAENNETDCINASDHYGCSQGSYIAEAIRKEIK